MIEVYLSRAKQLASARELVREDSEYASAIALLSIHVAIAISDALLIKLTGTRSKRQNHQSAVETLTGACTELGLDLRGIKHFSKLLSQKSDVSYGDKAVDFERAQLLASMSERFERWVYLTMEGLR